MENATKALLIAAAVLVVIMIITLGIVVYRMGSEAVEHVNLSGQEVNASNEKFAKYNGANKRGTEVRAMLQTVLNSNVEASANGETAKLVTVKLKGVELLKKDATSLSANVLTKIEASKSYNIEVNYGGTGGLVDEINVTAVGESGGGEDPTPPAGGDE